MIILPAPQIAPAEAAGRAGRGRLPIWLASPGDGDVAVLRQWVACDPVRVVRGSDLADLDAAWREERATWEASGVPGVPVGVGYLSYDLGYDLGRDLGRVSRHELSVWPKIEFRFYDALWVSDAEGAAIWARDRSSGARLAERLDAEIGAPRPTPLGLLAPLDPPERHLAGVERILEYLRAGDAYQVNLARRLTARAPSGFDPHGWALFARLQTETPAPHALWLANQDEGSCLIGNSPERFLRVTLDGRIETRPIKGTRPRSVAAAELAGSPKDLAEHVMIVDLERSDLGRICETGSVQVSGLARPVALPTVHHLVTTVSGRLRPGLGLPDILGATFPGGSVTGAPKIRAMEIIDELEPAARGPYTGATGWLGAAGDLDLAVAIRTALVRDERLVLWVGGGIVADSVPADELAETEAKAQAFARLCSA